MFYLVRVERADDSKYKYMPEKLYIETDIYESLHEEDIEEYIKKNNLTDNDEVWYEIQDDNNWKVRYAMRVIEISKVVYELVSVYKYDELKRSQKTVAKNYLREMFGLKKSRLYQLESFIRKHELEFVYNGALHSDSWSKLSKMCKK